MRHSAEDEAGGVEQNPQACCRRERAGEHSAHHHAETDDNSKCSTRNEDGHHATFQRHIFVQDDARAAHCQGA